MTGLTSDNTIAVHGNIYDYPENTNDGHVQDCAWYCRNIAAGIIFPTYPPTEETIISDPGKAQSYNHLNSNYNQ